MRTYYHVFPTCPYCHAPHCEDCRNYIEEVKEKRADETPEAQNEKLYYCPNCGAYFSTELNLLKREKKFQKTVEYFVNLMGNKNKLERLPVVWRIYPNTVEMAYIEWIKKVKAGKFLVTWPSDEVRFIPIMIAEYLLDNREKKAAVIAGVSETGDFHQNPPSGKLIASPKIDEVYSDLIFIVSDRLPDVSYEMAEELRAIDYRYFYRKSKAIFYRIRKVGVRNSWGGPVPCEFSTATRCKNRVIREVQAEYGKNAIRNYIRIRYDDSPGEHNKRVTKVWNSEGFIDITIEERKIWPNEKKIKYDTKWLGEVIFNGPKLGRISHIIPALTIKKLDDLKADGKRLFFISDDMNAAQIFELISRISPDLIVIQNADKFIMDYTGTDGRRSLHNFLRESGNSLIIMFSTSRVLRVYYGINAPDDPQNPRSITSYGVIPHTWDNGMILEYIQKMPENFQEMSEKRKSYPGPASTNFFSVDFNHKTPGIEIENIKIDSLDKFESDITSLIEGYDPDSREMINRFIKGISQTPLKIIGNYEKPDVFKLREREGVYLTYEQLFSYLLDKYDKQTIFNLKNAISEIYGTENDPRNPVAEKLIENVSRLLPDEKYLIAVLAKRWEVKGTLLLLKEAGFEKQLKNGRIIVDFWNNSTPDWKILKKTGYSGIYIISTSPPYGAYTGEWGRIKKIIFIGSGSNLEKFNKILDKRLDRALQEPLYKPSMDEPAPPLLLKILDEIKVPDNFFIREITEEIKHDTEISGEKVLKPTRASPYYIINKGEKVLILNDDKNNWFAVPEGDSLMIKTQDGLDELDIDDAETVVKKGTLIGKEILLNRENLYISFKTVFARGMFLFPEKLKFRSLLYTWDDFIHLYTDSTQWINYIIEAVNVWKEIYGEEAEDRIANAIKSLGISAKNPSYIKKWWNLYDTVVMPSGDSYRIYRIEHPKSPDDLKKIYGWLKNEFTQLDAREKNPDRCYDASILIQRIRKRMLKRNISTDDCADDYNCRRLHSYFTSEINRLLVSSKIFHVYEVREGETIKSLQAFTLKSKMEDNFEDYLKK